MDSWRLLSHWSCEGLKPTATNGRGYPIGEKVLIGTGQVSERVELLPYVGDGSLLH